MGTTIVSFRGSWGSRRAAALGDFTEPYNARAALVCNTALLKEVTEECLGESSRPMGKLEVPDRVLSFRRIWRSTVEATRDALAKFAGRGEMAPSGWVDGDDANEL